MKGLGRVVFPLCGALAFFAVAATAQTNASSASVRRYDSRIQMHTAPVTLQVPDTRLEMQKGAPELSDSDLLFQGGIPQETQIRPTGPRTTQEKQQNKNWILSSPTEGENEETMPGRQEEPGPSGWGWLADDVRARQQKQKKEDDQEDSGSKEKDDENVQASSAFQKENAKPNAAGIFLDTAFRPVSSLIPTKDDTKVRSDDTSARDESPEEQKRPAAGPTTAESPRNRTAADQPKEQKIGADATWGNEHLWNKGEKTVSALPQTEALLSMSKLNAQKPIAELDRPIFKPNVDGNGVEPNRLESSSRTLVTASSFQPLPAAPVNDLGTRPWSVDSVGTTPFGESTLSSSEPAIAPSQPIESLKAPELPKPVTSPWLR